MQVRDMAKIEKNVRKDGVTMVDFFGERVPAGEKVSMGYAVFPAGTVVPPAAHTGDEYSYVISGHVKCKTQERTWEMGPKMAGFIPAGEEHSSVNDSKEEATLIWMLIEK